MLYNVNGRQQVVKGDVILTRKKYTDIESFQLSSLLGNIIWIEIYFRVYVSAVVVSKLFTEILLILILRGDKKDPPSSEGTVGAILGRFLFYKQEKHGFPGGSVQSTKASKCFLPPQP